METPTSPSTVFQLDPEEALQTCLTKLSLADDDSSLRKQSIRPRKVSFGGAVEILITPKGTEADEVDQQPFLEEAAAQIHNSLSAQESVFRSQYTRVLTQLKQCIGLTPDAPTEASINQLLLENEDLSRRSDELKATLERLKANAIHERAKEKAVESELEHERTTLKAQASACLKDLKARRDKLAAVNGMYEALTNLKVEKAGDSFVCTAVRDGQQHKFAMRELGNSFTYTPLQLSFDVGSLLSYELTDLSRHELTMLFNRLFKAVNGK